MPGKNEMKWVIVYEADGEMEAEIIKGLLETSGIECAIDESATPYEITGMPANVNVPIRVLEKDVSTALELIRKKAPADTNEP